MKIMTFLIIVSLFSRSVLSDYGVIQKLRGKAFIVTNGNELEKDLVPLKTHQKVFSGQKIVTKDRSFVQVSFEKGTSLSIGPKSSIILNNIKSGEKKIVGLLKGHIRAKFGKNMSDKEKLQIKTKTASLAIRGTEFSIVYNQLNETTTAIGYSGDVRFSTAIKDGRSYSKDSVALKPGEFSSTFTKIDYVSSPTKMSPRQFQLLKENNNLKTRLKKRVSKKGDIIIPKELLASKKKEGQQVPKELLGNGHGQILESEIARKQGIRAGGYVDLNTGIYIEPPATAKYDSNSGVFEVPQTFGGIDPETGEYVPPLGLILHPLKGFTSAASLIQDGVKYVANKTVDFADSAITKSGEFGSKLIDGAGALGQALEDNTGVVGKAVGAPVRFAGNMEKNQWWQYMILLKRLPTILVIKV